MIDTGELLTNIMYADDLILYATSSDDICFMLEALQNELRNVGLHLNPSKTKAFTSKNNLQPMFLDIAGNFVDVMTNNETHKYLGRKLCAQLSVRSAVQLSFRVQCAWMQFHKHKGMLCDRNISLRSRLKFFDSLISPTILFSLTSCNLTVCQLRSIDVIQRKMLRNIVGWTRYETDEWSDTMRRMREKVQIALQIFPIINWTEQLMRRQFRIICRFAKVDEWAMRVFRWHPPSSYLNVIVFLEDHFIDGMIY